MSGPARVVPQTRQLDLLPRVARVGVAASHVRHAREAAALAEVQDIGAVARLVWLEVVVEDVLGAELLNHGLSRQSKMRTG